MREQEYNLKHLTKCPLCEAKYNHSQASVLEENEERTVFHLTCGKCGSAIMAFVTNSRQGVVSLGIATDLGSQEAKDTFKKGPVSKEDVLKVYECLSK